MLAPNQNPELRLAGLSGAVFAACLVFAHGTSFGQIDPVITQQPSSRIVAAGATATLDVQYTGTAPLALQWYFNGKAIADATNASLTLEYFQSAQAGGYFCVVENAAGTAISRIATVALPSNLMTWGTNGADNLHPLQPVTNALAVGAGMRHGIALRSDGTVVAWGNNHQGQTNVPADITNAVAVSAGGYHNLALRTDGTVVAWGNNPSGETNVPAGLSNVVAIAAGAGTDALVNDSHSLALKSDGMVVAWGNNTSGQTNVPANLTNVIAIAAGGKHSLALKRDGTIIAWGDATQTNIPPGATNIVAIAAGWEHSLGLKSDGTVIAWGMNSFGQATVPFGLSNVMAIAAGTEHSVALKNDGTLVAWGTNDHGQLDIPPGLRNVAGIACGGSFNLALDIRWKFLVYGDSRGLSADLPINTEILSELASVTTNEAPAFVLIPGDLVYSGALTTFQTWTNLMAPVYQAGIGVYPILGNHDLADVPGYLAVFGSTLPDNGPTGEINRTYSISCNGVLVLGFDDYVTLRRVNQGWMNGVLATNTQPHVFAFGHEPAFKASHYDCLDDYPENRDVFWNALRKARAIAYFCGHDHFYDHLRLDDGDDDPENDLQQFIVGTAGAPLYSGCTYDGLNAPWTPIPVFHDEQYGYLKVEICGDVVTMTWYHRVAPGVYETTGDVVTHTFNGVPDIAIQPVSRTNLVGSAASFMALAEAPIRPKYQWFHNGQPIFGATSSQLTVAPCRPGDAGSYSVVASNRSGTAQSTVATLTIEPDTNSPTLKVSSPIGGAHVLNATNSTGSITLRGTVSDDCLTAAVLYGVNDNPVTNATLLVSTNGNVDGAWSANVTLQPGTNAFVFKAVDYGSNATVVPVLCYFDVPSPVTLATKGIGTLVPYGFTDRQLLVGRSYKVTASTGTGTNYVLSNIVYRTGGGETGCIFTNTAALSTVTVPFTMKSNLLLTANFVPNPLLQRYGVYHGLFMEADAVRHHSAGYVTISVSTRFGVSGKLWIDGNVVAFSGKLNLCGTVTNLIVKRGSIGKTNLLISLDLGIMDDIHDVITGSVSDTNAGWTAELLADRRVWTTNQPAVQFTNAYTLVLPGFASHAEGPIGASWATATVKPLGSVAMLGGLADGVAFRQSTMLSKDGSWPLFAAMYPTTNRIVEINGVAKPIRENHGLLLGWLRLQENTNAFTTNYAPLGRVDWIKTGWTNAVWPDGFTNQAEVKASRWLVPNTKAGERLWCGAVNELAIALSAESNGTFTVSNVALLTNNFLSVPRGTTNGFKAALLPRSGQLSGSFYNSNALPPTNLVLWKGVLLQDYTNGAGSFMAGTNSGTIVVAPAP